MQKSTFLKEKLVLRVVFIKLTFRWLQTGLSDWKTPNNWNFAYGGFFTHFSKLFKLGKMRKNKTTQKNHENFWLNFCLNKECPKLLCGLGICHRRRQTIPMWNSLGEKGILQGITVCLVSVVLSTMWLPGSFQTVSRGHILVFFNLLLCIIIQI